LVLQAAEIEIGALRLGVGDLVLLVATGAERPDGQDGRDEEQQLAEGRSHGGANSTGDMQKPVAGLRGPPAIVGRTPRSRSSSRIDCSRRIDFFSLRLSQGRAKDSRNRSEGSF